MNHPIRRERNPSQAHSAKVVLGFPAVLLLERAGWRSTPYRDNPKKLTLLFLLSPAPELNPVETIWQHLRAIQRSNHVFDTFDATIGAACVASTVLIDQAQLSHLWAARLGSQQPALSAARIFL